MPVRTELSGPAAWFVIDDPPTRSAISRATAEQIRDVLARAERDSKVRAAVITGAGERAFASGADIAESSRYSEDLHELAAYDRAVAEVYDAIAQSRLPVIAAVQAAAIGGGGLLALACR